MQILALDDEAGGLKILLRAIAGAAPEADVEGFNVVWDALAFAKETKVDVAFLIDRRGSTCTRKNIAAYVFEDREYSRATQTYLTQVLKNMTVTLEELGIPEFLVLGQNSYAVNMDLVTCDSYDYLDGVPEALNQFHGEYMIQYSWAEESTYQFYE